MPCSPARAASMAAFSASRLVCSAMSSITSTILPMSSTREPSAAMVSAERMMAVLISSVPLIDLSTESSPASTAFFVFCDSSTNCFTVSAIRWIEVTICSTDAEVSVTDEAWFWELFATFWMLADISCMVDVVSSTPVAAVSLFFAACSAVAAICADADAIWSEPERTSVTMLLKPADHRVESISQHILPGLGTHLAPQVAFCDILGCPRHALHVACHLFKGIGKHPDLILPADGDLVGQVSFGDALGNAGHLNDRPGNGPGQE